MSLEPLPAAPPPPPAAPASAPLSAAQPAAPLLDSALASPAFVVDLDRARANCERMQASARAQGLGLRPHVKTHKTREGVALQLGGGAGDGSAARVVVSTLREAEFLGASVPEILYGVLLEPSKFARAWALHCSLPAFSVLLDSAESVVALDAFAAQRLAAFGDAARGSDEFLQAARRVAVFLAVDATQYGREGVAVGGADEAGDGGALDAAAAVAVAIARSRRLKLAGIYSHSGNSYNACSDPACGASAAAARAPPHAAHATVHADARAAASSIALRERDVMMALARHLRTAHGVAVPVVSVGSTPSASSGAELASRADGTGAAATSAGAPLLELHPGNYIFFDRQQVESGSCALGDVACYVIARVLSRYPGRNGGEFLIDAGGLALHKDPAGLSDGTWGCLLDEPGLVLKKLTQEVAVVGRLDGAPVDLGRFAPGAVVRVLPNHSCMTAAMHDVFHVVEGAPCDAAGSRLVVAKWAPVKFWESRER